MKAKRMKGKEKNRYKRNANNKILTKVILLIIIILISLVIILIGGKIIANRLWLNQSQLKLESNENNRIRVQEDDIKAIEKQYEVESIDECSFENVKIKTASESISYVSMNIKNNGNNKMNTVEIIIIPSNNEKRFEFSYKLPDIEANGEYNLKIMSTENLSDMEKIEIKLKK